MPDTSVAITAGTGTAIDTVTTPGGDHRQVVIASDDRGGYRGRVGTFRTPGRGATTQPLFTIFNATGSVVDVDVKKIAIDVIRPAVNAAVADYTIIRLWKVTALPTGGSPLVKVAEDSTKASNASVTVTGDASADGTVSATALTQTLPAGTIVTQEIAGRLFTAAGYEPSDRMEFLNNPGENITLNAAEGLCCVAISSTATAATATNTSYVVSARWEEYVA